MRDNLPAVENFPMTPSRGFAVQEPQPQSSRALLPLVGMTAVAWISGLVDLGHEGAWLYVLSVLLLASVVTPMLALSGRQPAWLLRISPMVFLASAAMLVLSQADEHSGLTVVVLLSVLTVAIRGSRTDSLITTAAMLATLLAIMEIHHTRLLVELRVLILCGAMGLVISAAIQGLRERLQLIQLQLESHANTDPLTGLANRRGLDTEVARLRGRRPFALLSIDVDGLKKVNDTQGHAAGDELGPARASAARSAAPRRASTRSSNLPTNACTRPSAPGFNRSRRACRPVRRNLRCCFRKLPISAG